MFGRLSTAVSDPPASESTMVTWSWFWPVLTVALALRIAVGATTAVPLHPDENLQYLEQAHRLVHGYGIIPWEYAFGIRSWLIPLFIAGLLQIAGFLGLDAPWEYALFVETVFCVISLALPIGMYRIAQLVFDERVAIAAFLAGCFWGHFVLNAHKHMPGVLAMYLLVWLVLLMLRPATTRRLIAIGVISGLITVIRFQLLPVVGTLALYGIVRYGKAVWIPYAGGFAVIAAAGVLDWWFWGGFLFSFFENFRLNFTYNFSSEFFGQQSLAFYAVNVFLETGGLALLALAGCFVMPRALWPHLAALGLGFLAFHIPDHKEFRFVIWLLPFFGLSTAALAFAIRDRANATGKGLVLVAVAAWSIVASVGFVAVRGGHALESVVGDRWSKHNDLRQIFFDLHDDTGLTGVELLSSKARFWDAPGYYELHRQVPIYYWAWHNFLPETEKQAFRHHVSHVVTEIDEPLPAGFVEIGRYGRFALAQGRYPETTGDIAQTYDFRVPWRELLAELGPVPDERLWPPVTEMRLR